MKAVILFSGLAGFLLFGQGLSHSHGPAVGHAAHVDTHLATHVLGHAQDQCRYQAERSLTLRAASGDLLRIAAGSGSLEVVGVAGLTEVRATALACASHEEFIEALSLTSERDGATLRLGTEYPDWSDRGGWGQRYARLDLRVELPEGMAGDIRDSSGDMAVANLGDLVIEDSSGEIQVQGILGDLRIEDSSGEIVLREVTGNVEIDDGSGEIDVRDVGGNLRVVRDGSGSIEVDGVGGDFIVERDGSGGIDYRNVTGKVDVPRKRR